MSGNLNIPSDMPTEHTNMIREKYDEFLKDREERKESQRQQEQKQEYPRPPKGISPKDLGLKRDKKLSKVELTDQVRSELDELKRIELQCPLLHNDKIFPLR